MNTANIEQEQRCRLVLDAARNAWERMVPVRERRLRHARYTYGDQWGDPVTLRDGRRMTEGELVAQNGRQAMSNNLIRRLVKSVVGRFRQDYGGNTAEGEGIPAEVRRRNRLGELDARTLEEFLISGMAVHYVTAERRPGGAGVWVDNVSPERFFVNAVSDPRCNDMELVGRLLDMSVAEVVMRFSPADPARAGRLRRLYAGLCAEPQGALGARDTPLQFAVAPPGRCRVIEVWTLECAPMLQVHDRLTATYALRPRSDEAELRRQGARRRRRGLPAIDVAPVMQTGWHGRFLAPDGILLGETDSPFPAGGSPFAVKLYPLTDGDVHSLVEDVIDQQRYVNRLITTMDHMMGTAAKGVLLFPVDCKLDGMDWEQVTRAWADPGGVIPYRPRNGELPRQVTTPMADIGARDMLQTQIRLFEEVSGVSQALMGQKVSAAVGAERYQQEVHNAAASIADLMETYRDFLEVRDGLVKDLCDSMC